MKIKLTRREMAEAIVGQYDRSYERPDPAIGPRERAILHLAARGTGLDIASAHNLISTHLPAAFRYGRSKAVEECERYLDIHLDDGFGTLAQAAVQDYQDGRAETLDEFMMREKTGG